MLYIFKFRLIWVLNILLIGLLSSSAYCQPKKLIDLDFKNADVKDVLRVLAVQNGANFLIDNEVNGTITIHLTKVTFEAALSIIAQSNNLEYTNDNNVYRITQVDQGLLNVDYNNDLLTVEAKNAKLILLIENMAKKTGLNLVTAPDLKERITINLQSVPVQNALDAILIQANCVADKNGAVTFIRKQTANQSPFTITYQNDLLTIDAQNVPLTSLTREITEKTGISVVPNQDVAMNINIFLQNLPLVDALTLLCNTNNLQLVSAGQAWRIAKNPPVNSMGQNLNINYDSKNGLFDVEIQSASLAAVISEMARKADLDVVVLAQVNWTINNIRLHKLKFDKALEYLLKGSTFTYKLMNNIYLIGDGLTARPENSDFTTVKVYPIKYLKADLLLNTLPAIFPRQSFVLLADRNSLIVTASSDVHKLFSDYLSQVDIDDNQDRTAVIKIKHLKAEDVLKYIPASISKTDLVVVKETNSITVTGPQNLINQVKQYVEKIDQVNPLIVFNIMVISIQNSNNLNWTPPSGSYKLSNGNLISIGPTNPTMSYGPPTTTKDTSGNTTIETSLLQLTYLLDNGKAKILSNPTITTLNGYAANFNVSTKRIYPVSNTTVSNGVTTSTTTDKTLDSGLYVTITPWVADDKITMEIKPKISEYGSIPQNSSIPETTEHSTETTVRVSNKQTVIISGLKNTRKSKSIAKVPILGDIPLLGYLFRSISTEDVEEEFVIVITPTIIYDESDRDEATKKMTDKMNPDIKTELNDSDQTTSKDKTQKAPKE
jgi:type II secretory pathway component GspD/PulD (secretin)